MSKRHSEIRAMGKVACRAELDTFFNSNSAMSYSIIHNGLKYAKAQMKLAVLYDTQHAEKEKEERLKEIDSDIHHLEELANHHLKYWGLLTP